MVILNNSEGIIQGVSLNDLPDSFQVLSLGIGKLKNCGLKSKEYKSLRSLETLNIEIDLAEYLSTNLRELLVSTINQALIPALET